MLSLFVCWGKEEKKKDEILQETHIGGNPDVLCSQKMQVD